MHTRGRSRDMYREADYADVVAEVAAELRRRLERALARACRATGSSLDPGLGFAKRAEHSFAAAGGPAAPGGARSAAAGRAVAQVVPAAGARRARRRSATGARPRRLPRRCCWARTSCACTRCGNGAGRPRGRCHPAGVRDPWRIGIRFDAAARVNLYLRSDRVDTSGIPGCSLLACAGTWTDLLDIVIAAIAIYELLKLMRGTRAVQMGSASACSSRSSTCRAGGTSTRSTGSSATWSATWCSRPSCCSRPTSAARWRTSAARGSSAISRARTRTTRSSRSWSWRRRCWPASGSARSSPSSATSACATTSRAASRSTRR